MSDDMTKILRQGREQYKARLAEIDSRYPEKFMISESGHGVEASEFKIDEYCTLHFAKISRFQ